MYCEVLKWGRKQIWRQPVSCKVKQIFPTNFCNIILILPVCWRTSDLWYRLYWCRVVIYFQTIVLVFRSSCETKSFMVTIRKNPLNLLVDTQICIYLLFLWLWVHIYSLEYSVNTICYVILLDIIVWLWERFLVTRFFSLMLWFPRSWIRSRHKSCMWSYSFVY